MSYEFGAVTERLYTILCDGYGAGKTFATGRFRRCVGLSGVESPEVPNDLYDRAVHLRHTGGAPRLTVNGARDLNTVVSLDYTVNVGYLHGTEQAVLHLFSGEESNTPEKNTESRAGHDAIMIRQALIDQRNWGSTTPAIIGVTCDGWTIAPLSGSKWILRIPIRVIVDRSNTGNLI